MKITVNFICYLFQGGYGAPGGLGEDGEVKGFDFNDQSIRKAFIKKVRRLYYYVWKVSIFSEIAVLSHTYSYNFFYLVRQRWESWLPATHIYRIYVLIRSK